MPGSDPRLDPPSWAPSWLSIDNIRVVRNWSVVVTVVFLLSLGACVVQSAGVPADPVLDPADTLPVPTTLAAPTTTFADVDEPCPVSAEGPADSTLGLVDALGTAEVVITFVSGRTRTFCVLVADTAAERNRGLMGITEFTTVEGMVFLYEDLHDGSFFMFNTPTPLVLTFWDADGNYISRQDMRPCLVEDPAVCDRFPAEAPFTVALELPRSIGAELEFGPGDNLFFQPLS